MEIFRIGQKIRLDIAIHKGMSSCVEDLSRSRVMVLLKNHSNKWPLAFTVDECSHIHADVPGCVGTGAYDVQVVWAKNEDSAVKCGCQMRAVMMAQRDAVMGVSADPDEVTKVCDVADVHIVMQSASYGYDGLSAYEMAVFRGKTTLSEEEWIEAQSDASDKYAEAVNIAVDAYKAAGDAVKGVESVKGAVEKAEAAAVDASNEAIKAGEAVSRVADAIELLSEDQTDALALTEKVLANERGIAAVKDDVKEVKKELYNYDEADTLVLIASDNPDSINMYYEVTSVIGRDGTVINANSYCTTFVEIGDGIEFMAFTPNNANYVNYALYNEGFECIRTYRGGTTGEYKRYTILDSEAKYVRWCGGTTISNVKSCTRLERSGKIEQLNSEVKDVTDKIGRDAGYVEVYSGSKAPVKEFENLKVERSFRNGDTIKIDIEFVSGGAELSVRARIDGVTKILYTITGDDSRCYTATDDIEYLLIVTASVTEETMYKATISKKENASGLVADITDIDDRVAKLEGKIGNTIMYESLLGSNGVRLSKESFVGGETMESELFPYYNKFGNKISFNAKVANFGKLTIYAGTTSYAHMYLCIDNTNMWICDSDDRIVENRAHGLDISEYISINLNCLDNGSLKVSIVTVNGTADYEFAKWNYACGKIVVANDSCSMANVQVGLTNSYFRTPFWIFGASQEGIANNRWLGQLRNLGYTDYLANALSGRNSVGILDDLKRALNFGCPKYVYFGLSNDDYVYNTYKSRMDAAKAVADEYGFEIIFVCKATTPTTKATYEEQLAKRNTVINYGCRYFDFGKAVAADPTDPNTLYANYLDASDGWVHPVSALGARAIAMQFLVDVPEIMQY